MAGLRERSIEDRRRRILVAMRDGLVEHGATIPIRDVARAAGLSVATLYNLFGSKEAIAVRLLAAEVDGLDVALAKARTGDALERCEAVVDASLDRFVHRASLFRPLLGAIEGQRASPERAALTQRCAELILRHIRDGAATEHFAQDVAGDLVARQIMWGYIQAIRYWAAGDLSHAGFRAQVRACLWLGLLSIATEKTRPRLTASLSLAAPTLRAISKPVTQKA